MRKWLDIATLSRANRSKGEFTARAAESLPFLLQPGMRVHLVPPRTDAPRSVLIKEVRADGARFGKVSLDPSLEPDVSDRIDGCHCLVPLDVAAAAAEQLGESLSLAVEHADLCGWIVEDDAGSMVGTIVGYAEHPTQLTLTLELPDGREKLVPLVQDLLLSLDEQQGRIRMQLPAGILEI